MYKRMSFGKPGWLSGLAPAFGPGSWDWVPHQAPHRESSSPSACVSASLCMSLEWMNKWMNEWMNENMSITWFYSICFSDMSISDCLYSTGLDTLHQAVPGLALFLPNHLPMLTTYLRSPWYMATPIYLTRPTEPESLRVDVSKHFLKDFIYLFMRDIEKEADTSAEGEVDSLWGAWCGTQSQDPGITPKVDRRSTTEPPGCLWSFK